MSSICQCCGLCRKSRHETYVDDVFPSVDEPTPVEAEMGKLVYYARTSPNNLNRVAGYLLVKLRRFIQRARYNQVEVAVSVMLRLLSDCPPQQVPHLADALLSMVHTLLEQRVTRLQVLACNTFASFCAVKEVTPLYQSVHYEFFVDRFSGLSLIARQDNVETYYNTRMAGLKGLEGMFTKASSSTGLQQYNIWEPHCMKKIVPALLINMQMTETEKSEVVSEDLRVGQLSIFSENLLKELVSSAGLGHIDAVLHPVLVHLDVNKCWMEQHSFAHHVFVIIMDSIQVQFRYKAVQALISHLDKGNPKIDNPSAKCGILDTVSQCIGVGSEGFLGPSAMDAFTKLLKHLKKSLDNCSIRVANVEVMKQDNPLEYKLQLAIITTIGNISKVLPDYEKSHVMSLIISYIPEHSTDDMRDTKLVMLAYQLLQCLKEVSFCYTPVNWTKTFPETLFSSFRKLFVTKGTMLQVNILEIWLYLLDNHNNRTKIPLSVSWSSLEEVSLTYGTEGSTRFMKQSGAEMFKMMIQYSKLLSVDKEVMSLYYKVMAVTVLECGKNKLKDCLQLIMKLQEMAVKESFLEPRVRIGLHCMAGGLLHLLGIVSGLPKLQVHVNLVMQARNEKASHFVIDNFFGTDSPDTAVSPSPLSPSEGLDDELLFNLEQAELQDLETNSPSPFAGNRSSFHSILLKHRRGSDTESTHSLDYRLTESPVEPEQITYRDIVADINSAQESSIPLRSPGGIMEFSSSITSRQLDINKILASGSSERSSIGNRITPKSAYEVNLPDL